MSHDDPLIALVAARNPVPAPEQLSPEGWEVADELRSRIRSAPPPRRVGARRHFLIAAAAVLPVAAVLVLAASCPVRCAGSAGDDSCHRLRPSGRDAIQGRQHRHDHAGPARPELQDDQGPVASA